MAADHPEDAGLDASTTSSPKHKLRWFQFSLRTLLVVMTVICVFLGTVFNYVVLPAERQRAAVQAIAKFQKSQKSRYLLPFTYEPIEYASAPKDEFWLIGKLRLALPRDYFDPVVSVDLSTCEFQDSDLVFLKQLPRLHALNLINTDVTDAGLENLKDLVNFEFLYLIGRKRENLTDIGIAHLKKLKKLKTLWIRDSTITDAGISYLSGMTELRELDLRGSNISDSGLTHLRGLTNLDSLDLCGSKITGTGLADLHGLHKLSKISLSDTHLNDSELVHLQRFKNLKYVELSNTFLTEYCIRNLRGIENQKSFTIFRTNTFVTQKGIRALKEAMPSLWVIPYKIEEDATTQDPTHVARELIKPTKDQRWRLRVVGKRGGRHFQPR